MRWRRSCSTARDLEELKSKRSCGILERFHAFSKAKKRPSIQNNAFSEEFRDETWRVLP